MKRENLLTTVEEIKASQQDAVDNYEFGEDHKESDEEIFENAIEGGQGWSDFHQTYFPLQDLILTNMNKK